jgi:hypothetical protein
MKYIKPTALVAVTLAAVQSTHQYHVVYLPGGWREKELDGVNQTMGMGIPPPHKLCMYRRKGMERWPTERDDPKGIESKRNETKPTQR